MSLKKTTNTMNKLLHLLIPLPLLFLTNTPALGYEQTAFLISCRTITTSRGILYLGTYQTPQGLFVQEWFNGYCSSSIQVEIVNY